MFFQKRRYVFDKECMYHSYCNYIQQSYPIRRFGQSNDRTLGTFLSFLWKNGHPFLFVERQMIPTLIHYGRPYRTNYFICKLAHLYTVLNRNYNYNLFVSLDSNNDELSGLSSIDLYKSLLSADYLFIELNDDVVESIHQTVKNMSDKNDFYKQQRDYIYQCIDMYKNTTKK